MQSLPTGYVPAPPLRPLKASCALLLLLFLLLLSPLPLHAADPVEVVVSGIEGDALNNVRESLALPPGMVREGSVEQSWLLRFARQAPRKIETALEPFGYYRARVDVKVEENKGRYRLLVKIEAGEPLRLSNVRVALSGPGSGEERLRRLVERFPLKQGDIPLHRNYEEAKAALLSRAQGLGYLKADFSRHEIRIDPEATHASIELVLETGQRYLFGETTITGAPDYPDPFMRRYLAYQSGQVFSQRRLGETQRNLANSERFKEVMVIPGQPDDRTLRVPVELRLKPAPRITLKPGFGYGTDTGFRGSLNYRDLNLFHRGHELYGQLNISQRLQGLVAGYVLPDRSNLKSATKLQLNLQREDTTSYLNKILGLELSHDRIFDKQRRGTAYLKSSYEDYTVGEDRSSSRLLLPGLRFSHSSYFPRLRPRRGFSYDLELRGTHRLMGSDVSLLQFLAEGAYLLGLPGRLSLHTRVSTGTTLLMDKMHHIPPSLRFMAGGDQSVRGYAYKSLGPKDESGDVVGGRHLLCTSVELERALFEKWGVSIFHDSGNAFDSFTRLRLYQGAGVGLHYYTSIGALNLSLARQIGVRTPSFRVHFTVGVQL